MDLSLFAPHPLIQPFQAAMLPLLRIPLKQPEPAEAQDAAMSK
jgi:hypothetical protein